MYDTALKKYKQAVRHVRIEQNARRDDRLLTILGNNPSSLYSFIKSSSNTSSTLIEKLRVGEKTYTGEHVPDGFYDAMTSLKSYNHTDLMNETVAEQLSTYKHIMELSRNIPNPVTSKATNPRGTTTTHTLAPVMVTITNVAGYTTNYCIKIEARFNSD